jgi:pimeloyl-ACP methyl ester carboxylesterase
LSRSVLLFLAAQIAVAQGGPGIEGNWLGALNANGGLKLRVALRVAKDAGGKLLAKLDSLDQNAMDRPVAAIEQNGVSVKFEMADGKAAYEGTLSADGSELSGTWRQGAASLPLAFHRVATVPVDSRPQTPKKPYPYTEEEVTYENKQGGSKLAGTLTLPPGSGPFPAVLLITGSGQQDRDESLMGHRPFLVLADHLTRRGIAVLRVDDRGMGGSTGDFFNATSADFAADVQAGIEFLKSRGKQIDVHKIGLIGHSEGGTIAPMVAARTPDIAFIVMMAGTGVPGGEVSLAQAEAISKSAGAPADVIEKNQERQRRVLAIVREESDPKVRSDKLQTLAQQIAAEVHGSPSAMSAQFQAAASPWFRFWTMYDPATSFEKVTCPVLALDGSLDLQVPPAVNLPAIEKALEKGGNPDYEIVKLPKLNHLFQTAQTGRMDEYGKIEETIAPVALETISSWILRHTRN